MAKIKVIVYDDNNNEIKTHEYVGLSYKKNFV